MQEYIYTVSKKKFYPLKPDSAGIDITDIAHALSLLCRANGHFSAFHSVGQHCIECCRESMARGYTPRVSLACLLHDASESYMSDVTTPVKNQLEVYQSFENQLINLIYEKYIGKLNEDEYLLVNEIDKALLYHEFFYFTGIELGEKTHLQSKPQFDFVSFKATKQEYLKLFDILCNQI